MIPNNRHQPEEKIIAFDVKRIEIGFLLIVLRVYGTVITSPS